MSKSKTKTNNRLKVFFFIFGLILILTSISGKFYLSTRLSFFPTTTNPKSDTLGNNLNLTLISIPEQNIELPLFETRIKNGIWQISENGASLLNSTAFPKSEDRYVIYAHNTLNKFGKITYLKPGSRIYLLDKSGKILKYEVTLTQIVNPNQVDVLTKKDDNNLILYTCTGIFDSKRFVVKAAQIS
jgi:LPXTG-site transpeptidase (sortase) family protein